MNQKLLRALCPHRGLGEENSLSAIENAIKTRPFMVEFDIQNVEDSFFLGHPPKLNRNASLKDALSLYTDSIVVPKIDLKCSKAWKRDVSLLLENLKEYKQIVLINIGGETISSTEYIDAENYCMKNSNNSTFINVDVARYGNLPVEEIKKHLTSLKRWPYSVSPMLEGDFDKEIKIALDCGIKNIHFWSNNSRKYSQKELIDILAKYSSKNIQVLFDIKPEIIAVS